MYDLLFSGAGRQKAAVGAETSAATGTRQVAVGRSVQCDLYPPTVTRAPNPAGVTASRDPTHGNTGLSDTNCCMYQLCNVIYGSRMSWVFPVLPRSIFPVLLLLGQSCCLMFTKHRAKAVAMSVNLRP